MARQKRLEPARAGKSRWRLDRRDFLASAAALVATAARPVQGADATPEQAENMLESYNHTRYRAGQATGHYESFFQRANHPTRPLAFWIRYTIFSPHARPEAAVGELWAIYFDGESGRHMAVKRTVPFGHCVFDAAAFRVRVGEARLDPNGLDGVAAAAGHEIAWDLGYKSDSGPFFILSPELYAGEVPKAKGLVGAPLARFDGELRLDGEVVPIDGWVGSQNHNWGPAHPDHLAYCQVSGFDDHPETHLDLITTRARIDGAWTPFLHAAALRHRGHDIRLNALMPGVSANGAFDYFSWSLALEDDAIHISADIDAPKSAFVGLRYDNPPGGDTTLLNTKIGRCRATISNKRTGATETFFTEHRALFEIMGGPYLDPSHGIPLRF